MHEPMTTADLLRLVDPAIAVQRALTAAEQHAFLLHLLVGPYEGADPADWIDEATSADAFADRVDTWWEQSGDKAIDVFMVLYELPQPLIVAILSAAWRAALGLEPADLRPRRSGVEIAHGAALWARGYAEGLGWSPEYPTPATAASTS